MTIKSKIGAQAFYIIPCFLFSIYCGYKWGHLLHSSPAAISALIDVFAIMAGVLVAVISIIGDPSMLLPGNWRVGWEHAQDMQKQIADYSNLFVIYLLSLILLVLCTVVIENNIHSLDPLFSITTGVSLFALLVSIPLPYSLMNIQKERMSEEVKFRKEKSKKNARKA